MRRISCLLYLRGTRIFGGLDGGDVKGEVWWIYTCLGSVVEEREGRRKRVGRGGPGAEEEEDAAFESVVEIQEKEREVKRLKRMVPVLTVWISKQPIAVFRDVFGEQKFRVVEGKEGG
jgi:hypothetical protein